MTRILITGCRHWRCETLAAAVVARLVARHGRELTIVHGAASGVDSAFARAATLAGIAQEPHPADWRRHGNAAGPVRNETMVSLGASLCLAVHRDIAGSRGTRHCAGRALAAGIPVWLVDGEDAVPRRLAQEDLTPAPRRTEGR